MAEILSTQVILKPLEPNDFDAVMDVHMSSYGTSPKIEAAIVNRMIHNPMPNAIHYGIRTDDEFVGVVELYDINAVRAKLGYTIHRDSQGRGYATAAAGMAVRKAFTTFGLRTVCANTHRDNGASRRVLENVGFVVTPSLQNKWILFALEKAQYERMHTTIDDHHSSSSE